MWIQGGRATAAAAAAAARAKGHNLACTAAGALCRPCTTPASPAQPFPAPRKKHLSILSRLNASRCQFPLPHHRSCTTPTSLETAAPSTGRCVCCYYSPALPLLASVAVLVLQICCLRHAHVVPRPCCAAPKRPVHIVGRRLLAACGREKENPAPVCRRATQLPARPSALPLKPSRPARLPLNQQAPEQLIGLKCTAKADVYSYGLGEPAFQIR